MRWKFSVSSEIMKGIIGLCAFALCLELAASLPFYELLANSHHAYKPKVDVQESVYTTNGYPLTRNRDISPHRDTIVVAETEVDVPRYDTAYKYRDYPHSQRQLYNLENSQHRLHEFENAHQFIGNSHPQFLRHDNAVLNAQSHEQVALNAERQWNREHSRHHEPNVFVERVYPSETHYTNVEEVPAIPHYAHVPRKEVQYHTPTADSITVIEKETAYPKNPFNQAFAMQEQRFSPHYGAVKTEKIVVEDEGSSVMQYPSSYSPPSISIVVQAPPQSLAPPNNFISPYDSSLSTSAADVTRFDTTAIASAIAALMSAVPHAPVAIPVDQTIYSVPSIAADTASATAILTSNSLSPTSFVETVVPTDSFVPHAYPPTITEIFESEIAATGTPAIYLHEVANTETGTAISAAISAAQSAAAAAQAVADALSPSRHSDVDALANAVASAVTAALIAPAGPVAPVSSFVLPADSSTTTYITADDSLTSVLKVSPRAFVFADATAPETAAVLNTALPSQILPNTIYADRISSSVAAAIAAALESKLSMETSPISSESLADAIANSIIDNLVSSATYVPSSLSKYVPTVDTTSSSYELHQPENDIAVDAISDAIAGALSNTVTSSNQVSIVSVSNPTPDLHNSASSSNIFNTYDLANAVAASLASALSKYVPAIGTTASSYELHQPENDIAIDAISDAIAGALSNTVTPSNQVSIVSVTNPTPDLHNSASSSNIFNTYDLANAVAASLASALSKYVPAIGTTASSYELHQPENDIAIDAISDAIAGAISNTVTPSNQVSIVSVTKHTPDLHNSASSSNIFNIDDLANAVAASLAGILTSSSPVQLASTTLPIDSYESIASADRINTATVFTANPYTYPRNIELPDTASNLDYLANAISSALTSSGGILPIVSSVSPGSGAVPIVTNIELTDTVSNIDYLANAISSALTSYGGILPIVSSVSADSGAVPVATNIELTDTASNIDYLANAISSALTSSGGILPIVSSVSADSGAVPIATNIEVTDSASNIDYLANAISSALTSSGGILPIVSSVSADSGAVPIATNIELTDTASNIYYLSNAISSALTSSGGIVPIVSSVSADSGAVLTGTNILSPIDSKIDILATAIANALVSSSTGSLVNDPVTSDTAVISASGDTGVSFIMQNKEMTDFSPLTDTLTSAAVENLSNNVYVPYEYPLFADNNNAAFFSADSRVDVLEKAINTALKSAKSVSDLSAARNTDLITAVNNVVPTSNKDVDLATAIADALTISSPAAVTDFSNNINTENSEDVISAVVETLPTISHNVYVPREYPIAKLPATLNEETLTKTIAESLSSSSSMSLLDISESAAAAAVNTQNYSPATFNDNALANAIANVLTPSKPTTLTGTLTGTPIATSTVIKANDFLSSSYNTEALTTAITTALTATIPVDIDSNYASILPQIPHRIPEDVSSTYITCNSLPIFNTATISEAIASALASAKPASMTDSSAKDFVAATVAAIRSQDLLPISYSSEALAAAIGDALTLFRSTINDANYHSVLSKQIVTFPSDISLTTTTSNFSPLTANSDVLATAIASALASTSNTDALATAIASTLAYSNPALLTDSPEATNVATSANIAAAAAAAALKEYDFSPIAFNLNALADSAATTFKPTDFVSVAASSAAAAAANALATMNSAATANAAANFPTINSPNPYGTIEYYVSPVVKNARIFTDSSNDVLTTELDDTIISYNPPSILDVSAAANSAAAAASAATNLFNFSPTTYNSDSVAPTIVDINSVASTLDASTILPIYVDSGTLAASLSTSILNPGFASVAASTAGAAAADTVAAANAGANFASIVTENGYIPLESSESPVNHNTAILATLSFEDTLSKAIAGALASYGSHILLDLPTTPNTVAEDILAKAITDALGSSSSTALINGNANFLPTDLNSESLAKAIAAALKSTNIIQQSHSPIIQNSPTDRGPVLFPVTWDEPLPTDSNIESIALEIATNVAASCPTNPENIKTAAILADEANFAAEAAYRPAIPENSYRDYAGIAVRKAPNHRYIQLSSNPGPVLFPVTWGDIKNEPKPTDSLAREISVTLANPNPTTLAAAAAAADAAAFTAETVYLHDEQPSHLYLSTIPLQSSIVSAIAAAEVAAAEAIRSTTVASAVPNYAPSNKDLTDVISAILASSSASALEPSPHTYLPIAIKTVEAAEAAAQATAEAKSFYGNSNLFDNKNALAEILAVILGSVGNTIVEEKSATITDVELAAIAAAVAKSEAAEAQAVATAEAQAAVEAQAFAAIEAQTASIAQTQATVAAAAAVEAEAVAIIEAKAAAAAKENAAAAANAKFIATADAESAAIVAAKAKAEATHSQAVATAEAEAAATAEAQAISAAIAQATAAATAASKAEAIATLEAEAAAVAKAKSAAAAKAKADAVADAVQAANAASIAKAVAIEAQAVATAAARASASAEAQAVSAAIAKSNAAAAAAAEAEAIAAAEAKIAAAAKASAAVAARVKADAVFEAQLAADAAAAAEAKIAEAQAVVKAEVQSTAAATAASEAEAIAIVEAEAAAVAKAKAAAAAKAKADAVAEAVQAANAASIAKAEAIEAQAVATAAARASASAEAQAVSDAIAISNAAAAAAAEAEAIATAEAKIAAAAKASAAVAARVKADAVAEAQLAAVAAAAAEAKIAEAQAVVKAEAQAAADAEAQAIAISEANAVAVAEAHTAASSEAHTTTTSDTHTKNFSEVFSDSSSESHSTAGSISQADATSDAHSSSVSESDSRAVSESHSESTSEAHVANASQPRASAASHSSAVSETHSNTASHTDSTSETDATTNSEAHSSAVSESDADSVSETHADAISESDSSAKAESSANSYTDTESSSPDDKPFSVFEAEIEEDSNGDIVLLVNSPQE